MAYINTGTGSVQTTLTPTQLAALRAYIIANKANNVITGPFYNFTAAQIQAALNAPTTYPNPSPTMMVVDPIPPMSFSQIVRTIATNLLATALPAATQLALIQAVNNLLTLQGQVPLPLSDPKLAVVVAQFVAAGFTQANVNSVLMVPTSPTPPTTLVAPSWAYTNLGGVWLEVADVAVAMAQSA